MKENFLFRIWFYFRNGWGTYFAFIFAAINTLTVTYFLAIENYPFLNELFPSFVHYVVIVSAIGVPILVGVGYAHFKRSLAYSAEADIVTEAHPYNFRILPGWNTEVVFPLYLTLSEMMIKWSKDEKLNNEDIEKLKNLQDKIQKLLRGEMVGEPRKKINTKFTSEEKTDN
tara:strand:+ start:357 stop:869 length:513 start_codon:yes stop_codon:yes gene_type:complete